MAESSYTGQPPGMPEACLRGRSLLSTCHTDTTQAISAVAAHTGRGTPRAPGVRCGLPRWQPARARGGALRHGRGDAPARGCPGCGARGARTAGSCARAPTSGPGPRGSLAGARPRTRQRAGPPGARRSRTPAAAGPRRPRSVRRRTGSTARSGARTASAAPGFYALSGERGARSPHRKSCSSQGSSRAAGTSGSRRRSPHRSPHHTRTHTQTRQRAATPPLAPPRAALGAPSTRACTPLSELSAEYRCAAVCTVETGYWTPRTNGEFLLGVAVSW